jgi:hypothetical protein
MRIKLILIFLVYLSCSVFFLFSRLLAQQIRPNKYTIELHILEPSMLVLNRSISKSGNWSVVLGAGFSGKFFYNYLSRPMDIRNGNVGSTFRANVCDFSIRRYLFVHNSIKLGVLLQSGVQYRNLDYRQEQSFFGSPRITFHQVLPYIRAGIFYRLSKKFELGTLAGIGVHVYDVTGITELMLSGYVGYKLGRIKPK